MFYKKWCESLIAFQHDNLNTIVPFCRFWSCEVLEGPVHVSGHVHITGTEQVEPWPPLYHSPWLCPPSNEALCHSKLPSPDTPLLIASYVCTSIAIYVHVDIYVELIQYSSTLLSLNLDSILCTYKIHWGYTGRVNNWVTIRVRIVTNKVTFLVSCVDDAVPIESRARRERLEVASSPGPGPRPPSSPPL